MTKKLITFGIPCYNSQDYMDKCISSILEGANYSEDIQINIVDDGSKDQTSQKADEWQTKYPNIIQAIHQENGGHGIAVLAGLHRADGIYYKVVDSDDWLDKDALSKLLDQLRYFVNEDIRVDLVIANYVYEHVEDNTQNVVDYKKVIPVDRLITWDDMGHFGVSQYLLMHSLCYRTDIVLEADIQMPRHTFYVDNLYAYNPLPLCKSIYYMDLDLYRYFIGRDDQSVNEDVLISRIDHYWRVSRLMMQAYKLDEDIDSKRLRNYMMNYFTIIMAITAVFSRFSDRPEAEHELKAIWNELSEYDEWMYRHARKGVIGVCANLPGTLGKKTTKGIYKAAQKIMKFN